MPEVPPIPAPKDIEVGQTPLYLKKPIMMKIDHKPTPVVELQLHGQQFDKNNIAEGPNNGVILLKNNSHKKGEPPFNILRNVRDYDKVRWDDFYGIMVKEEDHEPYIVEKKDLTQEKPAEFTSATSYAEQKIQELKKKVAERRVREVMGDAADVAPGPSREAAMHEDTGEEATAAVAPPPETPPAEKAAATPPTPPKAETPTIPPGVSELERRATEPPKSISLIGVDVDQMIAERAAKDIQNINAEGGSWFTKMIRGIWKGNIANELLEEHAYQFRKKQVDAAHMMLTDQTFSQIETRAKVKYDEAMRNRSGFGRAWTKFKDAIARNVGGYTTVENLAIAETGQMYANNEFSNITEYENNVLGVRARFEKDFLDMDGVIRKNLGENLDIFKSGDPRHKEIVDGVKDIVHNYVNGTYTTKRELESAMSEFAKAQNLGTGSKDFREAQLYASSLFQIAENAKTRIESGTALTAIDAELDKMEVRVGRAQMGESTQFQRSSAEKIVSWMVSKNIVGTLFANEASAGTAAAVALTLGYLPRYVASRVARIGLGATGGGAVAGTIAGLKENARMKREYFTFLRERETGGGLAQPGDKLRAWMQAREIPQTDVNELISRLASASYRDGKLRELSGEDLQKTLAYLADAKARRAISARGGANISLIRWGPAVDVGRANLDLSIDKLERDLGPTYTDQIKALTNVQTRVLTEGRAAVNDPLVDALGAVSDRDPSVKVLRRKFLGLYGEAKEKGTAQGLDASLREVKTAIRFEATRRGINAGVIGAGIGTALSEVAHLSEQLQNPLGLIREFHNVPPTGVPTHAVDVTGLPHYTDLQGIDHAVQAHIPEHTVLGTDSATNTYTLFDNHGTALVHGIQIDQSGQIVNADALNGTHDAAVHGLHFSNLTQIQETPGTPGTVTGGGYDISAGEMAGGKGEWDWMVQNMNAAHVHEVAPATNVTAKLFHFYETNVTHNQNVDIAQIPDYHRVVHYLTDAQGNQVIDYNKMPDNMWFHNLPDIFRPENQATIGTHMDHAMDLYHKVMEGAPTHGPNVAGWKEVFDKMDSSGDPNAHLDALLYKIGVADRPLTDAEFTELMHLLGTPGGPPAELITNTGIIEQTLPGEIGVTAVIDVLPTPAVAPLPRQGMMPGTTASVPAPPKVPTPSPTKGKGEKGFEKGKGEFSTETARTVSARPMTPPPEPKTTEEEEIRRKKTGEKKTAEPAPEESKPTPTSPAPKPITPSTPTPDTKHPKTPTPEEIASREIKTEPVDNRAVFEKILSRNDPSYDVEVPKDQVPTQLELVLQQLAPSLGITPGDLKITTVFDEQSHTWKLTGEIEAKKQTIHVTLAPDEKKGFSVSEMKLDGFGAVGAALGLIDKEQLLLQQMNSRMDANHSITKLTMKPDGNLIFSAKTTEVQPPPGHELNLSVDENLQNAISDMQKAV